MKTKRKPMATRKPQPEVLTTDIFTGLTPSTNDERLLKYLKKRAIYEANQLFQTNLKLIGDK